jgi:hypothetical protein
VWACPNGPANENDHSLLSEFLTELFAAATATSRLCADKEKDEEKKIIVEKLALLYRKSRRTVTEPITL